MRIMIATFGQETNTFSPDRIGVDKFLPNGWIKAETLLEGFRGTKSYLGGAIAACDEYGVDILPLDSVEIDGGPMITAEGLEELMDHFCSQVKANWQQTDGLFLGMHGAGSAQGVEDLESYVLTKLREIVGRDYPIMSSLDIHGNITPEMLELSDGLFVIKEYPHTDMAEAAYLATKTLIRTIRGEVKPVMTLEILPIILPNTTTTTIEPPMASVRDYFAAYCAEHGFIDVTMVQGFSANDQYWAGASVLIVAERDATKEAKELAKYFWDRRHDFDPHPLTAAQAIDRAQQYDGEGYVVINESSDNPGSGCPGDGTHLLRELVERDLPKTVFAFIYDPETALQAHKAGVGATIHARIGGKTAAICGEPLELDVQVVNLSDGNFNYVTPQNFGVAVCLGLTARLRHGNVDIVVASYRTQSFDDRPLVITGGDPHQYKIICLKSAGHFRAYFKSRAGLIVPCEMPGLRSTNLKTYPYQKIRHPVYPLDDETTYTG